MAKRSSVITMSPLVLDQEDNLGLDLDLWEVVNPSDAEYSDDSFAVSDDDVISLNDASFVSTSIISPSNQILPEADGGDLATDLDLDGSVDDEGDGSDLGWFQRRILIIGGGSRYSVGIKYNVVNDDNNEEDRGVEDGDYDLDDELVPRNVSRKLCRERLRKLGKRGIGKIFTSKTSLYSQLKPGCVRGKYGLGLKYR